MPHFMKANTLTSGSHRHTVWKPLVERCCSKTTWRVWSSGNASTFPWLLQIKQTRCHLSVCASGMTDWVLYLRNWPGFDSAMLQGISLLGPTFTSDSDSVHTVPRIQYDMQLSVQTLTVFILFPMCSMACNFQFRLWQCSYCPLYAMTSNVHFRHSYSVLTAPVCNGTYQTLCTRCQFQTMATN